MIEYISRQKRIKKYIKITSLIFSATGILGWGFFKDPRLGIISSSIIATISLIQLLEPHLYHSDEDIEKLNQKKYLYCIYFNKIDKLWIELNSSLIAENQALENFYTYKEKLEEDLKGCDKTRIRISNSIEKKLKNQ